MILSQFLTIPIKSMENFLLPAKGQNLRYLIKIIANIFYNYMLR